jgi:hypothetical protein
MMTGTVSKLNERNYRQWAIEAETVLFRQGLWKFVTGEMRVPRPPIIPSTSGETPTTPKVAHDPRDSDYNFEPESTEPAYLSRFDSFLRDWERWLMNNDKASGQITDMMEPTMQLRYREYKKPKELWDKIKADFEKMVKLDGQHELEKLVLCNLESYSSVAEWISAQDAIIGDLAICDVTIDDNLRKFYILSNLPKSDEWKMFRTSLELSGKADTTANIITHLQSFEVTLRRDSGIDPDSALFVTKKGRSRQPGQTSQRTGIVCYGCGENGHKIVNCMNRDKWASYADQKVKSEANLTSTFAIDSESYLF